MAYLAAAAMQPPAIVLGCEFGGHCAPAGRNHEVFAKALPTCTHTVVPDSGHADLLDGRLRTMGRLLCSRGSDPDRAREQLAEQVVVFLRSVGPRDLPPTQ